MAQGKSKLKKVPRKAKPVRGDQQKLRKGNRVLKAKAPRALADQRTQQAISKAISMRIESTMASRASSDGAGLVILASEAGADKLALGSKKRDRPLGAVAGSKRKRT
uniref:Uncharacterized protein n=1 Tax=Chrysotila carterae TaxID=13221 RepID=A0A7S4FBX3_CHRCT|mmetsp:Transcript_48342/g.104724  ORF Transcript_48342/g.104724 Transcript_48342/m.104724 type:complete len:107 (-) Transcript_48342:18-338(-)